MKLKFLLVFLLSISLCKCGIEYSGTINFSNEGVTLKGEGVEISGTTATIKKAGTYTATGVSTEGNIIIKSSNVILNLENLDLSSSTTAPIIVNSNLNEVTLISLENVFLRDLEEEVSTTGECAVIKIKKGSVVHFQNQKDLTLIGNCKDVIKGGAQSSVIFDTSNGEYKIDAQKNAIGSDGSLEFNGGKFTIVTKSGDAIKSMPDDDDTDSLGLILVNDGTFDIQSFNDAFKARKNIIIVKGIFDIKTENGYDSTTFNKENESAKGFKVSNNVTGSEIKVYNGEFSLNTADDAFHSNGNLTLLSGKYLIHSKDDGLHAGSDLVIGKKDAPLDDLNINILYSYEAIEAMTIKIYSGWVNATATDDGINSAGGNSNEQGPGQGTMPGHGHGPGSGSGQRPGPPGDEGNDNYFISIYGGEVNVYCDGDGLDSNGNVFIHGGNINIFSQGNRDNEPIDHGGSLTLFNAEVLCVGAKGMEYVHSGIQKGNQMYAYYAGSITKNKILRIKDANGVVIKEGTITKDINYIFYTSSNLNQNYHFYLVDGNGSESNLSVSFGTPTSGEDDGN